jgi:hypothetical protein
MLRSRRIDSWNHATDDRGRIHRLHMGRIRIISRRCLKLVFLEIPLGLPGTTVRHHSFQSLFLPRVPTISTRKGQRRRGPPNGKLIKRLCQLLNGKLRRLHYNGSNEERIEEEFTEIKTTIDRENQIIAPGWKPMFVVPEWRMRLIHGILVQVFTQMTGYGLYGNFVRD